MLAVTESGAGQLMAILIRQVVLNNFKSIASCKVSLRDITVLVGPNGAGKSNFIDGMRLVSDALNSTLEYALRQRGGINEVRRRSGGHPTNFAISLRMNLPGGRNGLYALRVGARPEGAFSVRREEAHVSLNTLDEAFFVVEEGNLKDASKELSLAQPKVSADRLFLTASSGILPFRELFDALSTMRFYSINPATIKELQVHDAGERLEPTGWNLPAVIKRMHRESPATYQRVRDYLQHIVPDIEEVEHKFYGPRETLEFQQASQSKKHSWRFHAANMSDGTLRSLGVLTALFHPHFKDGGAIPFVGIEEPEITIHPGAASVIMDALIEAAGGAQVVATTHSPDLLDHPDVKSDWILAVTKEMGNTQIAAVDDASVKAMKEALYTPGELLRVGQLSPNKAAWPTSITDSDLFESL